MDPLTRMVEHHIWMTGEMIVRAATLTDEQLDAPLGISDDDKTLRRMLSRLVGQLDLWNRAISGEVYDFSVEHDEDIASMRERFAEVARASWPRCTRSWPKAGSTRRSPPRCATPRGPTPTPR